jgi:hypothetical protein
MSGSFTSNGLLLPSCANQQSFALGFAQSSATSITWPRTWRGFRARAASANEKVPDGVDAATFFRRRPDLAVGRDFGCSGKFRPMSPVDSPAAGDVAAATFGWWNRPAIPTPSALRVRLQCGRGSAGGSCSAYVRLTVAFLGSTVSQKLNKFEKQSEILGDKEYYGEESRTFNDTDGLLGVSLDQPRS